MLKSVVETSAKKWDWLRGPKQDLGVQGVGFRRFTIWEFPRIRDPTIVP